MGGEGGRWGGGIDGIYDIMSDNGDQETGFNAGISTLTQEMAHPRECQYEDSSQKGTTAEFKNAFDTDHERPRYPFIIFSFLCGSVFLLLSLKLDDLNLSFLKVSGMMFVCGCGSGGRGGLKEFLEELVWMKYQR